MIDLYYFPTPNGHKVTLFLEEAKLDYQLHEINILKGDQFDDEFLKFSPNNKMPAIIDQSPADGGEPVSVFESGAILLYLAEKTGLFLSKNFRERKETLEWLFWQMAGFGPMLGQNHHFVQYAPKKIDYAIERYVGETERLYSVLENRLEDRDYIVDEYSIADMATYPWAKGWEAQKMDIKQFPNVKAWLKRIEKRPATQSAYQKAELIKKEEMNDENKKVLFGNKKPEK